MKGLILLLTFLLSLTSFSQMTKKELLDYALSKDWIIFKKRSSTYYSFSSNNTKGTLKEFIDVKFIGPSDNSDLIAIRFLGFSESEEVVWDELGFSIHDNNMMIEKNRYNKFIGSNGYKVVQKPFYNSKTNKYLGIRAFIRHKSITFDE